MSRYIRPPRLEPPDNRRTLVTQYALACLIIVAGFVLIGRTPIEGIDGWTWVGFVLLVFGGVWFGALWAQCDCWSEDE